MLHVPLGVKSVLRIENLKYRNANNILGKIK